MDAADSVAKRTVEPGGALERGLPVQRRIEERGDRLGCLACVLLQLLLQRPVGCLGHESGEDTGGRSLARPLADLAGDLGALGLLRQPDAGDGVVDLVLGAYSGATSEAIDYPAWYGATTE